MSIRQIIAVTVTLLVLAPMSNSADTPLVGRDGVTTTVSLKPSELKIDVRVVSKLDKPIEIYEDDLPWRNYYSMVLVAAALEKFETTHVLESEFPIADKFGSPITLKPGEEKSGEIDLTDHFPELQEKHKKYNILLFWNYQLKTVDRKIFERQGGWLLIPKSAK